MEDHGNPGRGWRWLILGSSLLIFTISSLYGYFHGYSGSQGSWKGYYTLAVDAALPVEELDGLLAGAGLGDAITAGTAITTRGTAAGLEHRSWRAVAAAEGVPDPRRDDWVAGLGVFFTDRERHWHLCYLPANESLTPLMLRLGAVFDSRRVAWRLLEWQPFQVGILAVGALLAGGLVLAASRGRRVVIGLSLLPWLPVAMAAGPVLFALPVICLASWSLLLESLVPALLRYSHDEPSAPFFWDRPSDAGYARDCLKRLRPYLDPGACAVRGLFFALSLAAFLAGAWLRGLGGLLPGILVTGLLAWPGLLLLLARMYQIRHRRAEHQLFAPVPIMTRRRVLVTSLRPILWPLVGVAAAAALLSGLTGGVGPVPAVPVPAGPTRGGLTYDNAAAVQSARQNAATEGDGLPDASDLVRHLAFQSSLPWLRDYDWREFRLPPAGKALEVPVYRLEGLAVQTAADPALVYGDAWLGRVRAGLPRASVERMMLDQGRIAGLVFATAGKVYSADIWIAPALAGLVFLALPFWLAGRNPGFRQLYGSSRITALGRKAAA